jgi:predicted permease
MLPPRARRVFRLAVRRPDRLREEVDEEIQLHIESRIEQLVSRGMTPEAARVEAERRFGDTSTAHQDIYRSASDRDTRMRIHESLASVGRDLRYAARALIRRPGFALGVIITLALGIGANVTMFGIVDRLLLRPPRHLVDPDHVGRVYAYRTIENEENGTRNHAYKRYLDVKESTRSFTHIAAFGEREMIFGVGEQATQANVGHVSGDFWALFGVRPALGRFFSAAEDQLPAGTPVVVLSHAYWRNRMGGDSSVVGRRIRIGSEDYAIVGVAPRGFTGMWTQPIAAFIPITNAANADFGQEDFRGHRWHDTYNLTWAEIVVRRKPGVSVEEATADLTNALRRSTEIAITRRTAPGPTIEQMKPRAVLGPVLEDRGPKPGPGAKVATWLAGVALLVLVMACANVANLLLARAAQRRREVAVRVALGVSRARLLVQHLAESLLLALAGGVAAFLLARWGGGLLRATLLPDMDWTDAGGDGRMLVFTLAAALTAGLVTGLVPALQSRNDDVADSLKAGGREGSLHRSRLRASLLVMQAAVSVVLLVGAGLFVRSLRNVRSLDLGYDTDRVLYVETFMRGVQLDSVARRALLDRLKSRAKELPSVENGGVTFSIPFLMTWSDQIFVPGKDTSQLQGDWLINTVSPEYFATMGTAILRGRGFAETDRPGSERVMVLSTSAAKAIWPNENPLGKCVRLSADTMPCVTVVGVSEDIRRDFQEGPGRHLYYSFAQEPARGRIMVRTRGAAAQHSESVRRELQRVMPGDSYVRVQPLADIVAPNLRQWELGATMFTLFGLLALLVASVGLYSVVAYGVTQRSHELGVRVALGAKRDDLLRLVLTEGVRVTSIGVVLGTIAALFAGKYVAPLLYQVSERDPMTFAGVLTALMIVAVLASLVPAMRASRADPLVALRSD